MKRATLLCSLALALAVLSGCSPAQTGLTGNTLSTNTRPAISITANEPLQPVASGRLWVSMANNRDLFRNSTAAFNYAVFSEPGGSGLVTRHAHATITRLNDNMSWRFQPDTWRESNAFTFSRNSPLEGYRWTMQTLRVPSQGDWFSDMWVANGREVPEVWLAKRWGALLNDSNKAVLEYREPWPDCLEAVDTDLLLISGDSAACLSGFNSRAANAFTTAAANTPLEGTQPASVLTIMPASSPNTLRLVGEVTETGIGGGSRRD